MMVASGHRIESIDLLRGVVIVLMALDHVRDFFGITPYPPEDLANASVLLFLTRWVTHFCAPVFVFLAGVGAFLYQQRGRTPAEVSRFLITRGVWLIFMELVWVNLSFGMIYYGGWMFVQVIWAIGWSMIVLGLLLWLPRWLIAAFGLVMVIGHNLLDGIKAEEMGGWANLWGVLHEQHWIPLGETFGVFVVYPLVPWVGVMALGYVFGEIFQHEASPRRRKLILIGVIATVGFIVLRGLNMYGDPSLWSSQERGWEFTVLSFLNTTKYPPSLLFLLMTLGPAIILLPYLEKASGWFSRSMITFGRVPFFFYMIHIPTIHLLGTIWSLLVYGKSGWWFTGVANWPESYASNLLVVYIAWVVITALLYPVCRWFGRVKMETRSRWLSYF